jgi:hypothetical protein
MKYPNLFPFKIWQVVQVLKKNPLYGVKQGCGELQYADHPQEKLAMAIVQGGK